MIRRQGGGRGLVIVQSEEEGRAAAGRGLGPDASAMAPHDPCCRRQTQTDAFKLLLAMQALKQAEELVGIFHVEADAVIANEKYAIRLPADLDHTSRLVAAVLEGVGQQVGEYLAHQLGVAVGRS